MTDHGWTRRKFLSKTARYGAVVAGSAALPCSGLLSHLLAATGTTLEELISTAPEARFWVSAALAKTAADCGSCHAAGEVATDKKHAHESAVVRCLMCARQCTIADGERGMCRARYNNDGKLLSLVYGRPLSVHVDPIEKKPFYHFLPGSRAFSLSTSGCPLRCKFCQNWEISQARPEDYHRDFTPPDRIAAAAVNRDSPVIAFTYNEPTVFTEYLTDIARAGREKKRRSVLISCGYMAEAPLTEMCETLDGIKIDLKGFSEGFYRDVCGAELRPVLRSIKQVAKSGTHLEIVNLVVPTLNDSEKMLTELAKWVVGEIGPDVPVHYTRFHPDYQLRNLPPTPIATLERAREIALKHGMHYPFVGNVPGHPGNNTYCPMCGEVVIGRTGFFVTEMKVTTGRCEACNEKIAGVWK